MRDLLDLAPFLRRKKSKQCEHRSTEVDDDIASLTCVDCGSELDPWWYLRKLAQESDDEQQRKAAQQAEHEAWCEAANAKVTRLHNEIVQLTEKKNRLWNERIDGQPLGGIGRRKRRPKAVIGTK